MAQYTPFTFTADFTPQDHDKDIQEVIQGIEMQGMNEATQRIVQEMLYRSANATGQPIISYTRLWLTELSAHINTTLAQLFEKIDKELDALLFKFMHCHLNLCSSKLCHKCRKGRKDGRLQPQAAPSVSECQCEA